MVNTANSDSKQQESKHPRDYRQLVMGSLNGMGRGILGAVNWIDEKGPFVTAVATVAIAVLTGIYVYYSHAQWTVMRSQLIEMEKTREVVKESADLQIKVTEGSQAAWLIPSQQVLNRNLLSFGLQNQGGVAAEHIAVTVQIKLVRISDNHALWEDTLAYETVKYLPSKQNTNGQAERMLSKYTRQDFERITKEKKPSS